MTHRPYIILIHFLYPLTKNLFPLTTTMDATMVVRAKSQSLDDDGNTIENINEDEQRRIRW